jgi:hypothetical protein
MLCRGVGFLKTIALDTKLARFGRNRGLLWLALFASLLAPNRGWANTSKNCPSEPSQAGIVSGETYYGSACVLTTASDQDKFTFSAAAGDTWKIVAGSNNVEAGLNICLTLNDPKGNRVAFGCSAAPISHNATLVTKLTTSGVYTVIVTETSNGAMNYGVSLERISPPPTDAPAFILGKTVTTEINPVSAQDAYTFYATTTGTYQVSATMTSGGAPENLCLSVYQPGGTTAVSLACTATPIQYTTQAKFTPAENGTFVLVVFASDNDYTLNYDVSVACISAPGTCGSAPPTCSLTDVPSYDTTTATLTMKFSLGTPVPATWNAWLTTENSIQSLWSTTEPITEPPVAITKLRTVAKSGRVGVLSTLTTPTGGITCSNWQLVSTGTP